MADDVNTVHTWLQGTLLPDATQRQAAEEALEAAAAVPAHVVCLFRLCADPAVPAAPEYRQAAAVRMKNLITKRWEAPSDRARDGLAWANGEGPARRSPRPTRRWCARTCSRRRSSRRR